MIHEYKENFKELIEYLSQTSGIRADILEKDYYVSLLLNELAQTQNQTKAYFKGGTALRRFINMSHCLESAQTHCKDMVR